MKLGGSSEERKMKALPHSSPKIKVILLLHRYNFSKYFFQWLIHRTTWKANQQKKPQHFTTSNKLMLVFKRKECKYWFSSNIPAGRTPAAHHPEVCWGGISKATVVLHHLLLWSCLGASCPDNCRFSASVLQGEEGRVVLVLLPMLWHPIPGTQIHQHVFLEQGTYY